MSAPDIFLSYNREDAAVAKLYADAFAREGLEVWWDQTLRSGETYDEVTEAALRGAKAVVVLWSPRSVQSHWVRAEATIAHRAKTLVPATIEPCDKPVMFELTQTAELSHWRGAEGDAAWLAFLGDVRRMVGKEAPALETKPNSESKPAAAGVPKVAVLPIVLRGGGEDLEFLAEDLTEEITRELARDDYFDVIAASTMAAWRGKAVDKHALQRELDARYVVESKLQRSGETMRLTVQIAETKTGNVLWSERMARKGDDVEASPELLAGAITAQIAEKIYTIETKRAIAKQGPYSGWEHVLRFLAFSRNTGSEFVQRGLEEARQAVEMLPDLGMAHAMLVASLAQQVLGEGDVLDDAKRSEMLEHVRRAMLLADDNPTVIWFLAMGHIAIGDGQAGLRLAQRAMQLNPNSSVPFFAQGLACMVLGRTTDAIAAFEQQDRLTPTDAGRHLGLLYLGVCHLLEGRPEEGEEAIDRALALIPHMNTGLKWKAIVAAQRGDERAAVAAVKRLKEVEPGKSIEQHVRQMLVYAGIADRMAEPVATLRRLWDATQGDA